MKRLLYIIILLFIPLTMQSQDSIKGKLFTSHIFKKQFPLILVYVDGFIHRKVIDDDGFFELKIEKEQDEYLIYFEINDSIVKTYNYKHEWTKRKRSKSIAFEKECEIISKSATKDIENDTQKLYVFQVEKLSKKDLEIQMKYNFTYVLVSKDEIHNFDCYKRYNDRIFKCLVLSKDVSKDILNKNTIGIDEASINGPCLNIKTKK
ncbi:hypothetical protein [Tenacibaculum sp. M341]|uniref:hypothetical protein n=1 Tax=Tenacibaculum sp. M341 TaxID=2530339 RepID=UPI001051B1C8|nr:hypothetical protein [Tenacibaculum sp. M341]TCI91080.1 hypothetical protein EYW44_12085 [Tenacibaculum sp. M341]